MAWFLLKIIIQVILEEGGWVEFHHLGREIQIKIFFWSLLKKPLIFPFIPYPCFPIPLPSPMHKSSSLLSSSRKEVWIFWKGSLFFPCHEFCPQWANCQSSWPPVGVISHLSVLLRLVNCSCNLLYAVLHPQITMAVKTTHREKKKTWTEIFLKVGILLSIYEWSLGNIQSYSLYPNPQKLELGILKKMYSKVVLLGGVDRNYDCVFFVIFLDKVKRWSLLVVLKF